MKYLRSLGGAVFAIMMSAGVVSLVQAQDSAAVRVDIDSVASALELSEDSKQALAPRIDALNAALERRWEHWQEGTQIQQEFVEAYDSIANTLTAAQLREFHWFMRSAAVGPRAARWDRGARYQGRSGMRGFNRGRSRMRAGRGGGFNRGRPRVMRYRDGMRSPTPRIRPMWRPDGDQPTG